MAPHPASPPSPARRLDSTPAARTQLLYPSLCRFLNSPSALYSPVPHPPFHLFRLPVLPLPAPASSFPLVLSFSCFTLPLFPLLFSPPAPFSTSTCRHPPPLPTIIPSSLTLGFMLLLGAVCFVLHSMPSSDSSLLTYSSWPICFHCPLLGFSGWGLESALHKFCSTGEVGKVEEVVKRFIVRMNGSTNTYYFLLAQDALFSGA